MMNEDLKLRLKSFEELTLGEETFWDHLVGMLTDTVASEYLVNLIMIEIDPPTFTDDDTAFVEFNHEEFDVYLDHRMPFGMCIDYLIHELAHVGTWWVNEPEDHGPMFGVEYARLYRTYLEVYEKYWEIEQ